MFKESILNLEINHFENFPQLYSQNEIDRIYKELDFNQFSLLPVVGIGMVKKSYQSRGVINELEDISKASKLSEPLSQLLSIDGKIKGSLKQSTHYVPANLSGAQMEILDSIDSFENTYVVGPPGTGKSFTIASIAIDAITKGKSILISSRNNQAVDVIAQKIEKDFGIEGVVIRGGRKDYAKELKNKIENIVNGIGLKKMVWDEVSKLKLKIDHTLSQIAKTERALLEREQDEKEWGAFLKNDSKGFLNNIRRKIIVWKHSRRKPYWLEVVLLKSLIIRKEQLIKKYVRQKYDLELYATLKKERKIFQSLLKGFRARTANKRDFMFRAVNFKYLFKAFPVWLVRASDINDVLPLYKDLFDIVVLDEASQCDIASSIPVLYRGKKSVIVGDPKQLRHVSFLAHSRQKKLLNDRGLGGLPYELLNFRDNSILDLISNNITNQDQIHFLDEHYRSKPDIIDFSNQMFYGNGLKIMTQSLNNEVLENVRLHHVEGKRNKKGYNKEEAAYLIDLLKGIINREISLEDKLCQSIGILSPFKDQVDYLKKCVEEMFTITQIKRHHILVGTPYAFQGEERDIMLLSFVLDDDAHPSAFQYLSKADVLNVSITRARTNQHILISFSIKQLDKNKIFTKYIASLEQANTQTLKPVVNESDMFANEIKHSLKKIGVQIFYDNYSLAGFKIDILFIYKEKSYGIDLVGYPGNYINAFPIGRYKMLFRIGLKIITIPYSTWLLDQDLVINELEMMLE